ncbi:8896_t:CDS:1, partial [Gigaspora margarita]
HEVWRLQGKNTRGSARRQLPGTDARNFSKVRDQLPPPIAWNRHEQLLATKRFYNFIAKLPGTDMK